MMTGKRYFHKMLFPIGNAFLDCTDDIPCLANTDTDLAAFIADNNNGSEAHFLATFDCFGDSTNLDNTLLPL